jgi:predicted  nucleic acid-binding Zn-ribbon protein
VSDLVDEVAALEVAAGEAEVLRIECGELEHHNDALRQQVADLEDRVAELGKEITSLESRIAELGPDTAEHVADLTECFVAVITTLDRECAIRDRPFTLRAALEEAALIVGVSW